MNYKTIGFLGTGNVAKALATLLHHARVPVLFGSRSPERAPEALKSLGTVSSYQQVIDGSEIVILTTPFSFEVLAEIAKLDRLSGKIIVDAMNPLKADWSPWILGTETSAGEEVQKALPHCHVVKAFNTLFADMMDRARIAAAPVKPAGFLCGNSVEAKTRVSALLATLGLSPVDVGSIAHSRYLEAMAHLNIAIAVTMKGGTHAFFGYYQDKTGNS